MRRLLLLLPLVLLACSDEDAGDTVIGAPTTTTSPSSTTAPGSTVTTAFAGATTPTSVASSASTTALLAAVAVVEDGGQAQISFVFETEGAPGIDVQYIEPPILQDGSGEPIDVEGEAFLQVRMEPASGVDLSVDPYRETYTGPERVAGRGVVTEVVRTGDFEANLTWVIGLASEVPFRVETTAGPTSVVVSVPSP